MRLVRLLYYVLKWENKQHIKMSGNRSCSSSPLNSLLFKKDSLFSAIRIAISRLLALRINCLIFPHYVCRLLIGCKFQWRNRVVNGDYWQIPRELLTINIGVNHFRALINPDWYRKITWTLLVPSKFCKPSYWILGKGELTNKIFNLE